MTHHANPVRTRMQFVASCRRGHDARRAEGGGHGDGHAVLREVEVMPREDAPGPELRPPDLAHKRSADDTNINLDLCVKIRFGEDCP